MNNFIIIQNAAMWSHHIPGYGWINLATINKIQHDEENNCIKVTWVGGTQETFTNFHAQSIIDGWQEYQKLLEERLGIKRGEHES